MDKLFILTILGVQAVLFLMGIIALKHKLNSVEGQIMENKRILNGIENDILKSKLDIACIRGNSNMINDKLEAINNNVLLVRQSNFEIDSNIAELNKIIKHEASKNLYMNLEGSRRVEKWIGKI
ncbi:hypothetical protein [Clostridium sp.]|uniref:hypothetical protein n=1 Tax=Clostridium sp. TaxID=1506 RepID=UPI003217E0C7